MAKIKWNEGTVLADVQALRAEGKTYKAIQEFLLKVYGATVTTARLCQLLKPKKEAA